MQCMQYRYGGIVLRHYDGLMQNCSKSIANALELLQSYTKSLISALLEINLPGPSDVLYCHLLWGNIEGVGRNYILVRL